MMLVICYEMNEASTVKKEEVLFRFATVFSIQNFMDGYKSATPWSESYPNPRLHTVDVIFV